MANVIVSYVNPDLDGVACSIALQRLKGSTWAAHRFGEIDEETKVVLEKLGLPVPPPLTSWHDVSHIWLVDTHHLNQLPPDLPTDLVIRITDHHPDGDLARFPNADTQNESVGAAATLVAEQIAECGGELSPTIAVLLQAAIVSNTLDFRAPATSSRDHRAFSTLRAVRPLPGDLIAKMREARQGVLKLSTAAILQRDVKSFQTELGLVIVSQIEAPGALEILERRDLPSSLTEAAVSKAANAAILNVVDTAIGASAIVSSAPSLLSLLAERLCESICADGVIRCGRVLQRKTDIVPFILRWVAD